MRDIASGISSISERIWQEHSLGATRLIFIVCLDIVFPSLNDAKYWLIRVVKNASLNYVKRKERERKAYEKVLYEDHRKADSGETDLLKVESIKNAREALKKLPKNLQDVLLLREYADLNYKEIGKILGITEGNVKVRIFRAREQLVKLIGEDNVFLPQ